MSPIKLILCSKVDMFWFSNFSNCGHWDKATFSSVDQRSKGLPHRLRYITIYFLVNFRDWFLDYIRRTKQLFFSFPIKCLTISKPLNLSLMHAESSLFASFFTGPFFYQIPKLFLISYALKTNFFSIKRSLIFWHCLSNVLRLMSR